MPKPRVFEEVCVSVLLPPEDDNVYSIKQPTQERINVKAISGLCTVGFHFSCYMYLTFIGSCCFSLESVLAENPLNPEIQQAGVHHLRRHPTCVISKDNTAQ